MRFWLDTEFIERPCTIDLISIGIVSEDGREFYAESADVDWSAADSWIHENVVPHLTGNTWPREDIADELLEWVRSTKPDETPEFWGYYCDYDWVVFCWLFGRMVDLPKGFPMFCRDVKQLAVDLGNPRLPKQEGNEHNALADARWTRAAWEFLQEMK